MCAKFGVFPTYLSLRLALAFGFKFHSFASFENEVFAYLGRTFLYSYIKKPDEELKKLVDLLPSSEDMNILLDCQEINRCNAMSFRIVIDVLKCQCPFLAKPGNKEFIRKIIEAACKFYTKISDEDLSRIEKIIATLFKKDIRRYIHKGYKLHGTKKKYMDAYTTMLKNLEKFITDQETELKKKSEAQIKPEPK